MNYVYKTILAHFDSTERAGTRLRIAARLAEDFDAHLAAVYSIVSPLYSEPFVADGGAFVAQELLRFQEKKDQQARDSFDLLSSTISRPIEWRTDAGDPATVVNEHGRYSDLLVLGQYDPDQSNDVTPDFVGRVILGAGRPVLVIPFAGEFPEIGSRIMIAWNGSRESARAVGSSMAMLRRASEVQIITFKTRPSDGSQPDAPGTDVATYLARHGVNAIVSGAVPNDMEIGAQILSRAAELGSNLIVMGGYGHSRAFEFVMGGATRSILSSMTVPVLFAH
jgi:nucleotide-binding universal stress UspA family protein